MAKKAQTKPVIAAADERRTLGQMLKIMSYQIPRIYCREKECSWKYQIKGSNELEQTLKGYKTVDEWPLKCRKCGKKNLGFDAFDIYNWAPGRPWGYTSCFVSGVSELERIKISGKIAEMKPLIRECKRDPRRGEFEAELEAAATFLGVKGGSGWDARLVALSDAQPGPDYAQNDAADFYWEHTPRAFRVRLEFLDRLRSVAEQWKTGLEWCQTAEEFDEEVARMRRLMKLVQLNPYRRRREVLRKAA